MQHDEMIQCAKSGGDLCYKIQNTPEITTYMSLSCGFWTNSLMKENEEFYIQQMEPLPELYKDLAWKDPKTNLIWIPQSITEDGKGIVFPYGSNPTDWKWAAVKSRPTTEEEKEKQKIKTDFKTDMTTLQLFEERDFIQALDYIGALNPQ